MSEVIPMPEPETAPPVKGMRIIVIDAKLLALALLLPKGAEIGRVKLEDDLCFDRQLVHLQVYSPDFSPLDWKTSERVAPMYRSVDKDGHKYAEFVGWGI